MKILTYAFICTSLAGASLMLAAGPQSQRTFEGRTIEDLSTNIFYHAQQGDRQMFTSALHSAAPGSETNLMSMILKSDMLTNSSAHIEARSKASARLNYHDDHRQCHFHVLLERTPEGWRVANIVFCR
ncbi:MAG TPA: hypothetical protein VKY92_24390 [Verrucomicrobiae bacterium]|nr:hypothetical protein [Verrucomicrobiae bacterium]